MTTQRSARAFKHAVRAFTLIELMVVVAIIILLVALTVSVTVILNQKSDSRRMERAMELLTMSLNEWETTAEKTITYGTDDPAGSVPRRVYMIQEITSLPDFHELTHEVVGIITKNSEAKRILSSIDPKLLHKHDDELSVFDPWDNDVVVIFPGRKFVTGEPGLPDADGTIRTPWENMFGVCENGKICFLSFGPDGKPGDLHLDIGQSSLSTQQLDDIEDAADNIMSYPLSKVRAP